MKIRAFFGIEKFTLFLLPIIVALEAKRLWITLRWLHLKDRFPLLMHFCSPDALYCVN